MTVAVVTLAACILVALPLIAWLAHGRSAADRAVAAADRRALVAEHNAKTYADLLANEKRRTHALVETIDTMAANAAADPAGAELRMLAQYARAIYADGNGEPAVPDRAHAPAEPGLDRDGLLRPGE